MLQKDICSQEKMLLGQKNGSIWKPGHSFKIIRITLAIFYCFFIPVKKSLKKLKKLKKVEKAEKSLKKLKSSTTTFRLGHFIIEVNFETDN